LPSPTEISSVQLARLIGTPKAPVIIDVRIDEDFNADPQIIPGAFRHSYDDVGSLTPKLKEKSVVIYCQKGKKLSQGSAAIFRDQGIVTETLQGGHFAWRDSGLPLVPTNKIPAVNAQNRTVWVTRHRPKIDRIACPWLIRRFIDPDAQFLFVSPADVLEVAEKFDATPFDVEGIFWTHRGEQCTFDTMISEFDLKTEPLLHLATIVRGADTNQHQLAPESAGLLAASLGFSRMYKEDSLQLDQSMGLYDAFYRWCRDATNEGHDWPVNSKP
jgi:rhodanese-related sulfurtransferase